jgi:poly(3-hydroxybutyrate) depolymerase
MGNTKTVTATDDLAFLSSMIARIVEQQAGRVDAERVYATGFSMGCMMAHRLALERSAVIAGFGCHGGTLIALAADLSQPAAAPARFNLHPMPAYMTGGSQDSWFISNNNVLGAWASFNGCSALASSTVVAVTGSGSAGKASSPTSAQ